MSDCMTIKVEYQPIELTSKQYDEYLKSDDIRQKFLAFSYEIQHVPLPKPYAFMRIMTYLEWFFDKVIEKKVPDEIARDQILNFNFERKMKLMNQWGLLIEEKYQDVDKLRLIRNEYAHTLIFDEAYITKKFSELQSYNDPSFKDLDPFDKTIAIVMDICGVLTTAINTGFQFMPTPKKSK